MKIDLSPEPSQRGYPSRTPVSMGGVRPPLMGIWEAMETQMASVEES
jgi:hypothetical protein